MPFSQMTSSFFMFLLPLIILMINYNEINSFPLKTWTKFRSVNSLGASTSDLLSLIPPIQQFSIIPCFLLIYTYDQRPRGYAKEEFLSVKEIPSKGKGVVARKEIPLGTIVGEFPGYVRNAQSFFSSKSSEAALSKARKYTWKVNDKFVIDPTNSDGEVEEKIKYLGGLYSVCSSLAYINEPSIKEDCNIRIEVEDEYPDRIKFISNRVIYPNEELLIDYGPTYNREDYNSSNNEDAT